MNVWLDCEAPALLSDAFDFDVVVAVAVVRLDPEDLPLFAAPEAPVFFGFDDSLTLLSDGLAVVTAPSLATAAFRRCVEPLDLS